MKSDELTLIVLIMQFLGIAGAAVFSRMSKKHGNVFGLKGATLVYLLLCAIACVANQKWMVYLIAGLIGFAMGGIQSLFLSLIHI